MRATKALSAGRRYLEIQRLAKQTGRPTDELIQLYALECFLDRLLQSRFDENFVLKGGVLLAALDARRPTRDIDLAARTLSNSVSEILAVIREIASVTLDDGLQFHPDRATAQVIREGSDYSGVRVTLIGTLSRAAIHLHVDVNVGDPIWPPAQKVLLPRLLSGALTVRGYAIEMVLAEKIVTAVARGTTNTRWRDFVDIYTLIRRHNIDATTFRRSLLGVAQHREVTVVPLQSVFVGFAARAQPRWLAWLIKQRLESIVPSEFSSVLEFVAAFSDPIVENQPAIGTWECARQCWVATAVV